MLRVLCLLFMMLPLYTYSTADRDSLTLVFTSDMPILGDHRQGGYARLASAVKHYRQSHANTLFIFGGNSLGPSPLATFDSGSHIVDLLNSIEPDVMGITKRDYSYYEEQLSLRAFEAAFPMVATNVVESASGSIQDGLAKSVLIQKGDIKVGVMAVIDPKAKNQYLLQRIDIHNIKDSVMQESTVLRERGADIVILMHRNNFPEIDQLLDADVIDLSLSRDAFASEQALKTRGLYKGKVIFSEADHIAVIEITQQAGSDWDISWQIEPLYNYQEDPELSEQRDDYLTRLARLMNLSIAKIEQPFDTFRLPLRSEENAFANLIVDAMLDYTKADIAIINSGIVRGDRAYQKGENFTREDLIQELPFQTSLVVLSMSGEKILKSIESGLDEIHQYGGQFPQLANLRLIFDSSKPAGSRVIQLTHQGQAINLERQYTVATSDFLYQGGDGYIHFQDAELLSKSSNLNITLSDILLNALLTTRVLDARIDGRMIDQARTDN